jgi:hypothetical protein
MKRFVSALGAGNRGGADAALPFQSRRYAPLCLGYRAKSYPLDLPRECKGRDDLLDYSLRVNVCLCNMISYNENQVVGLQTTPSEMTDWRILLAKSGKAAVYFASSRLWYTTLWDCGHKG